MRELTEYEKKKWFDNLERFEVPEFIPTGSEPDEAYEALSRIVCMGDYGLSDEFVAAAQVEALNMYYYQIHIYTGEYGGDDTAEDLGLPPYEAFMEKVKELGGDDKTRVDDDIAREAFDWAMDWRQEHWAEFINKQRADRLRQELERLEQK